MHQESRASIDVGTQHAQAFVRRIPRLHHDVVEFVAQEVFDYPLVARLHFQKIRQNSHRSKAALHHSGLEQPPNRLCGISMFCNDGLERSFLAQGRRVLRAKNVQIDFGATLRFFLGLDQAPDLRDLLGDAADPLLDSFKLKCKLPALSAEGFDLHVGVRNLRIQAATFAINACQPLFRLRQLIS